MTNTSTTSPALQWEAETTVHLLDDWFEAIEVGLRERVREFLQAMIESELETALARPRYGRRPTADAQNGDGSKGISGHRHGHRSRSLMGTFGRVEIAVPRARLDSAAGKSVGHISHWLLSVRGKNCERVVNCGEQVMAT